MMRAGGNKNAKTERSQLEFLPTRNGSLTLEWIAYTKSPLFKGLFLSSFVIFALYVLYLCGIISLKKVFSLKLYYDKRLSDPTYYAQLGVRNGKKTTTRNVKNFGKHSQLLLITDDPLAYVQEEIRKMNEDYRVGKVDMNVTLNFNEKIPNKNNDAYSKSDLLNVGYFYLQSLYQNLHLSQFFHTITLNSKITPLLLISWGKIAKSKRP